MQRFVVQLDKESLLPTVESSVFIDMCNYKNWLSNTNDIILYYGVLGQDSVYSSVRQLVLGKPSGIYNITDLIPVGNLEFVNYILDRMSHEKVKAINIPTELMQPQFTGREVANVNIDGLSSFCDKHKRVFVKPGHTCKAFNPVAIRNIGDMQEKDESYFVSEIIDIECEWRVFVHNSKIVDYKMYGVTYNELIDLEFVRKCIETYKESPKSYTLDIARLTNGKFVVIEVHNFIACGLYGFESDKLVDMIKNGWTHEIDK